jgi:hypothetical protein
MQGATPWMPGDDSAERKHAPATLRNREPIAEMLQAELPVTGKLEVASGSGPKGAPLILYGPWRREDVETAPSNVAFDASLKARDPRWGLRQVKDLDDAADAHAFARARLIEMPANNLMLVYRR